MQDVMSISSDEPIIYDLMSLNDTVSKFYNVPHHDIFFLYVTTPMYDLSTINTNEAPLTAVRHLQLAAHLGHSSQDIHQWSATKAKNFKLLSFDKVLMNLTLDNDTPLAFGKKYSTLQLYTKSCHEDATVILTDLSP